MLLSIVIAVLVLGGCGGDSDSTKQPRAAKPDATRLESCGDLGKIKDAVRVAGIACEDAIGVMNKRLASKWCNSMTCEGEVDGYSCKYDTCSKGSARIKMKLDLTTPAGEYPWTKKITIRVLSGREQPAPESWMAKVGQEVIFTIEGLGPPKIGIVGPGLGTTSDSSYGLTNVTGNAVAPRLKFTPKQPGVFRVSKIEAPLPLGTLTVTR